MNKKKKRNIETYNKYLAGLVDADGTITVNFSKSHKNTKHFRARFIFSICFDRTIHNIKTHIEEIRDYFGCGQIYDRPDCGVYIYCVSNSNKAFSCANRIKKHMVIKGQHVDKMVGLWEDRRNYSEEEVINLRKLVVNSRYNTGPIKPKNHLTNAWLAGYIDGDGYLGNTNSKFTYKNGKRYGPYRNLCLDFGCHPKDHHALELIQKAFGGSIKKGRENEIRLRYYFPLKNSSKAKQILIPVIPHLRLKKWDAEQILSFYNSKKSKKHLSPAETK